MWDALAELFQLVGEALADWQRTIRLLVIIGTVAIAVALLR